MTQNRFGSKAGVLAIVAALSLGAVAAVVAQNDMSKVEVRDQKLTPSVHVLFGAGGNIGLLVGPEGALVVDAQYKELSPKVLAAIKGVTEHPVKYLVNTHWHGDHTGGNENMANAGALIIAHDNVRKRMSEGLYVELFQSQVPPSPTPALPVITFNDTTTFHVNGEDVVVFHVAPAHTDGDALVWFKNANVVHMGDIFFNGMYPVIDYSSGGRIDGMITACDKVLPLLAADTQVIPGHGPMATKAELQAYRDMLVGIRGEVAKLVKQGKNLEQVVAAKPTAKWDEQWGKGFIKPDLITKILYINLSGKKV